MSEETTTNATPVEAPTGEVKPAAEEKKEEKRGRGGQQQQQGRRRRQKSRYGTQMEEKQSLKELYNIREGQLRIYYREAQTADAETGPELVALLERRLDNALYRAGFAETRRGARQMASHRHVEVNGRPVTVPSIRLRSGDQVTVRESKRKKPLYSNFEKRLQNVVTPSWMTLDPANFTFKVTALPTADEAAIGVDIRSIVEYFAR